MEEQKRYTDQRVGENEQMEREAITHFFPVGEVEKVTDKELQYKGVDYIVHSPRKDVYIDCKVHHYDSNYFVYECYDTRPAYSKYGWTNPDIEHLTTHIIYIVPAYKKAYIYSYQDIMEFQKAPAFKKAKYTDVKHPNGVTRTKVFRTDFIKSQECDIIVPSDISIKKNFIAPNSAN